MLADRNAIQEDAMKKIMAMVVVFAILAGGVTSVYAEYDKAAVSAAMKSNFGHLGNLKKALDANDLWTAAKYFNAFADSMLIVHKQDAPKGDTAVWKATLAEFINTAYKGVGACGEQDLEKAKAQLTELLALQKKGHGTFR